MDKVALGSSSLKVSRLCLGTQQLGGTSTHSDVTWGYMPEQRGIELVKTALDCGISFFDSAEAYGHNHHSEMVLGKALKEGRDRRGEAVIATKFGRHAGEHSVRYTPEDIMDALDSSLKALQTSYIDLYQVHWATNMRDVSETVQTLERAKALGKIKHYGVCNFGYKDLSTFLKAGGRPITNQLPYNLLWRAIEHDIMPLCRDNNISILPYSTLQQGLLTGRFTSPSEVPEGRRRTRHFSSCSTVLSRHGENGCEDTTFSALKSLSDICQDENRPMAELSLQWLLQQPTVAAAIVGASSPLQVAANAHLLDKSALQQTLVQRLSSATDALKKKLGPNADMWAKDSRIR